MNESWVLTAGHCCNGINGGEIAAGILNRHEDTEGQYSTFTKFLHPDYNPGNTNNDVQSRQSHTRPLPGRRQVVVPAEQPRMGPAPGPEADARAAT